MAGLGTRFQNASDKNPEYKKPKPFITVKGNPMVRWATGSLPFVQEVGNENLIFIILKEHNEAHNMVDRLQEIYSPKINVIVLDKVTRGATETVLSAKHLLNPEEEILITDSDHFFDGMHLLKVIKEKDPRTAGIIPVFRARNEGIPKWSYSLIQSGTNYIEKVAEKDRALMEAGAHANIGAYYFSKAKHFTNLAERVIRENITFGEAGKSEFYIAPLYQLLLDEGHKVQAAFIPEVWGLGTPGDLEYFLVNYKSDKPLY